MEYKHIKHTYMKHFFHILYDGHIYVSDAKVLAFLLGPRIDLFIFREN